MRVENKPARYAGFSDLMYQARPRQALQYTYTTTCLGLRIICNRPSRFVSSSSEDLTLLPEYLPKIATMDSRETERMSMLLSTFIERQYTGPKEVVDVHRRKLVLEEQLSEGYTSVQCGSRGEGLVLKGSDMDVMISLGDVVVMYPNQSIPRNMASKTILLIRKADCRPGYVHLELKQFGQNYFEPLYDSLVTVGNSMFLSNDIYRESFSYSMGNLSSLNTETNGPSCTITTSELSMDTVIYFPCHSWPKDASEWRSRPRLYGWPSQTLIDDIIDSGFALVPVGDKCSQDTFLQWRISLAKAERSLVHSFTHTQFKVYALLKYFLKQIKDTLADTIGDDDILCSYFLKTIMFHAVENTNQNLWQEKNFFYCFWFCINILVAWVRAGFCPNYFIPTNNLFKRKIHGQNQQILLDILNNYCQMKWLCLSFGNHLDSIWSYLRNTSIQAELSRSQPIQYILFKRDVAIIQSLNNSAATCTRKTLNALLTTQSECDEVFMYYYLTGHLERNAASQFCDETATATNNKTKYSSLKKCKRLLSPGATMGTNLLYLATLHFRLGNFRKALDMCKQVTHISLLHRNYEPNPPVEVMHTYWYRQSGHLWDRLRTIYASELLFDGRTINLPHISLETIEPVLIPPLPYAVFLTFLCCHELGDTRGRDTAFRHLVEVQGHQIQGGHKYWIVHNLLGICYQTLGDYHRAIRAFWDSVQSKTHLNEWNPAIKRIAIVYLCIMYASLRSNRQ